METQQSSYEETNAIDTFSGFIKGVVLSLTDFPDI
jgi:hypothetical protein